MLSEKNMEDAICMNPEKYLGESGLKLIARQFRIGNYIFDLLFEDRHAKLIVEIQKGTLDRNHTYKILDYYDEYQEKNPNSFIELMIIANKIPYERRKRLDSKGITWKEIPESEFQEQFNNINDKVSLPEQPTVTKTTNRPLGIKAGFDMFGQRPGSKYGRMNVFIKDLIEANKLEDITVDNLFKRTDDDIREDHIKDHLRGLRKRGDMARVVKQLTGEENNVYRIPGYRKD